MIKCGMCSAHLDYAFTGKNRVCAISFFGRSLSGLKAIGACLGKEDVVMNPDHTQKTYRIPTRGEEFQVFFTPVVYGKEKFYHALAVNKGIGNSFFLSEPSNAPEDFYNLLMQNFNLPLLVEWKDVLFSYSMEQGYLKRQVFSFSTGAYYVENVHENKEVYEVALTEEKLKEMVSCLLQTKKIQIAEGEMKPLEAENMDEYFKKYGPVLVENLNRYVKPLRELDGNVDTVALKEMKLYPQQGAQVNGVTELLQQSNYAILNMGMGTGKTICSTSMVEGYFVKKYLRRNPGKTLKDAYMDENAIRYRNIVMCPGHLVEKWANEIQTQVPYAKVSIIKKLSQLVEIQKAGRERTGKEWYVIGKDFAKLSYQSMPLPQKIGKKQLKRRVCKACQTVDADFSGKEFLCACGSKEYEIQSMGVVDTGLKCPHCGEILINNRFSFKYAVDESPALQPKDFARADAGNQRCHICGEQLWQPCITNINVPGTEWSQHVDRMMERGWHRATHYSNKKHKAVKTVWVHRQYEEDYWESVHELPLREKEEKAKGVRKFAPASYISKKLKGYFDFFILDEAHLFKGGATAQGNAMQALVSASKKQLMLTGTIAGGMATHLFYLLYRLDPSRMQKRGYKFTDELKFARDYGTVETEFETKTSGNSENFELNTSSKGRQKGSPRVKPGISPLIFSDYLLDRTVFLDLSDMSKYLPEFKEQVEVVYAEDVEEAESLSVYHQNVDQMKELSRTEGRGLLSSMLQFALAYPDHPYGMDDIKSAFTGATLVHPQDNRQLIEDGKLLAKEKRLLEIVKKELTEGRNSVVYCEFTGNPSMCVTHRLREILMKGCALKDNEVVIIEASSPSADKREEWMHKKAAEGAKVFIVNPRCVETGLDFCWTQDGVRYNYPTLIFYQIGYSLFTVWQASRRSYRLNQTEECRVYYMAYAGTAQQAAIQVIAEKQVATSAIQGKFSAEGLSAMAQGTDTKIRLAQLMSEMDTVTENGLQEMFDVLNIDTTDMSAYEDFKPMQTYYELTGANPENEKKLAEEPSFEEFLTIFTSEEMEVREKEGEDEALSFISTIETHKEIKLTSRQKKLQQAGQMTLF